ncbi:MAG TPA: hypothetical protein VHI13_16385 [Candidatus Kapabacteria bacterium]|nr:hypothetical protein [Candidatus Kapabacteria bacterium]
MVRSRTQIPASILAALMIVAAGSAARAHDAVWSDWPNAPCINAFCPSWLNDPLFPPIDGEMKMRAYMDAVSLTLDKRIRATLPKIDGLPRQLLALKYYLSHTPREIRLGWAWTPQQALRYRKTKEYEAVIAEVEKVKAKFAELNPGYQLRVSTEIRTLIEQIANWNQMPSVLVASQGLIIECSRAMQDTLYHLPPAPHDLQRFRTFLAKYRVVVIPTVSVPGLSQHGQLKAFDFVVMKGDRIAAGTESETIRTAWDRAGWTSKLKEAVRQSGARFLGPLASPREPWHYTYAP